MVSGLSSLRSKTNSDKAICFGAKIHKLLITPFNFTGFNLRSRL